ncbi:unnamed protein product [Rhizophagus irregularis]|nr:unnamed protein product [Rhizophagus irregularis]
MLDEYFERKYSEWNILGFLNKCEVEPFVRKMSYYISCLETIANQEEGGRREKAQCLLDRYRKEPKPDYKIARRWEEEHVNKQIHLHNPTLVKVNNGIGTIGNIETVNELSAGSKKEAPYLQSDDDDFQPAIPTTQKRKNLSLKRDKKSNVSAKKVKRAEENVDPFFSSNKAEGSTSSDSHSKNTSSSRSSPSLERPIARSSTPDHQIYSTSVNQELIKRLNQEKRQVKSIFEPISSNIIDTTNIHLMKRLNIKRDYHLWVPVVNDATEYIDQLIDNSDTRDKFRRRLQLPFIPPEEPYSFFKHYETNWVHCFANKLLSFFEAPRNPLLNKNSEGWLNCHILTPLIDDCFLTCEEVQVHRGEEMSFASIEPRDIKNIIIHGINQGGLNGKIYAIHSVFKERYNQCY